jgi:hypothetical protein
VSLVVHVFRVQPRWNCHCRSSSRRSIDSARRSDPPGFSTVVKNGRTSSGRHGTVDSEKTMNGKVDIGSGAATGSFTAKKK